MTQALLLPQHEAQEVQQRAAIQGLRMELASKNLASLLAVEYGYALEQAEYEQAVKESGEEEEHDPFGVGHLRDDEESATKPVAISPSDITVRVGMLSHFAIAAADQLLTDLGIIKPQAE